MEGKSHPLRMCGLKYKSKDDAWSARPSHIPYGCVDWNKEQPNLKNFKQQSHPLRMCGLKYLHKDRKDTLSYVTSLTDVWIEIFVKSTKLVTPGCHIPYGCVDWNFIYGILLFLIGEVTSLTDVWIEINWKWIKMCNQTSHIPYGCVDWNICWIKVYPSKSRSHPLRMCGLK